MGKSMTTRALALGALALLALACGSSKKTTSNGDLGDATGAAGADQGSVSCVPGTARCDGANVRRCDASGASETTERTCSSAAACADGTCVTGACTANALFCDDQDLRQCDARGQSSTLVQRCAPGTYCRDDQASASCSTQACSPGSAVCSGSVVTTCLGDGSGPKPGGVDCADSKQACYKGECRDVACAPGTRLCQHDDVYLCGDNGTDLTLWADCQMGEVCDGDLAACRAKLCEPGRAQCDGSRAVTCNDFGSAWLPDSKDCSVDGQLCVAGTCKPSVCVAGTSFCQDGSVYRCDASGASASLYDTCEPAYEHCQEYVGSNYAFCRYNDCQAGTAFCSGNMIVTCNDDGTVPANGISCSATQYCDNATCKDQGCTSGELYCDDGGVYYCPYGAPGYLNQACPADAQCKELGAGNATCSPLACSPQAKACLKNQIGTCADDGVSLKSVSDDCALAGNVCGPDLKCAKTATDTAAVAESAEVVDSGMLLGDVVEVTSSRKLTELQMQLVLAAPRDLRWVVYELSGSTYTAKIDKVVGGVSGSGFTGSGALSFTMTAGKRYLLGVVLTGGNGVDYYDSAPFSAPLSFGALIGRVESYYATSIDAGYVDTSMAYQMKLVTEASP